MTKNFTTFALFATLALNAQQPTYSFHAVLWPGSTNIFQSVTEDTVSARCHGPRGDTTLVAMELSDGADIASVLRWYDEARNGKLNAVYIGSECIAEDGDVINGRILAGITGPIAISGGKVAYEALYNLDPA